MKGEVSPLFIAIFVILTLWQLFWKGIALWRSARMEQRYWFVALFVLLPFNDAGIVALVYLFRFARKRLTIKEVKSWLIRKA